MQRHRGSRGGWGKLVRVIALTAGKCRSREREESFKADSSRQAKRIRERRREKKRNARVKAQKATKKAQSKLQDCVDRETLLVEEATHPPCRFS